MRVLVLGSGVIGTASAYYLARAGFEVVVVDRQNGPALETSFANAGQVSPGYASPWAGPGIPVKAIKWLLMTDGPLVLRPKLDPRMWIWGLQLLANCTERAYAINKGRMVRLAEYSRDMMIALRAETGLAFDGRQQGTVQLFREQKQLDHAADDIAVLKQYGVPYEVLDPILEMYVEDDMTAADIVALGHDEALVRRIARLVDLNEYKRRQCPPGVRISTKAFGKDRRLPITNAYRG